MKQEFNKALNLESLSIGWIDEVVVRNGMLIMDVISFDKELKIKCDGVISLKVDCQEGSDYDAGNVVDVSHQYRILDSEQCFAYYYDNTPLNIIRIEGDYIIKIICKSVFIFSEDNDVR